MVQSQAIALKQDIESFLGAARTSEERRRFERVKANLQVALRVDGDRVADCVLDISAGGVRLAQLHEVSRGQEVQIDVPGLGTVRTRVADVSKAGTHLQFPMDVAHLQTVEDFIQPLRIKAAA